LPNDEDPILNQLVKEYEILQDKIDKIGGFRFTIKGWSITLVVGVVFAGSAAKAVPPFVWGISLVLFVAAFYWFEREQVKLSNKFGQRVLLLEREISSLLRGADRGLKSEFIALKFVPGIGHHLKPKPKIKPVTKPTVSESDTATERLVHKKKKLQGVSEHMGFGDAWFYYAQAGLVIIFAIVLSIWPRASSDASSVNSNYTFESLEDEKAEVGPTVGRDVSTPSLPSASATVTPILNVPSRVDKPNQGRAEDGTKKKN
jgi:hypothetical protein